MPTCQTCARRWQSAGGQPLGCFCLQPPSAAARCSCQCIALQTSSRIKSYTQIQSRQVHNTLQASVQLDATFTMLVPFTDLHQWRYISTASKHMRIFLQEPAPPQDTPTKRTCHHVLAACQSDLRCTGLQRVTCQLFEALVLGLPRAHTMQRYLSFWSYCTVTEGSCSWLYSCRTIP